MGFPAVRCKGEAVALKRPYAAVAEGISGFPLSNVSLQGHDGNPL